jgi:hypothetical protein
VGECVPPLVVETDFKSQLGVLSGGLRDVLYGEDWLEASHPPTTMSPDLLAALRVQPVETVVKDLNLTVRAQLDGGFLRPATT